MLPFTIVILGLIGEQLAPPGLVCRIGSNEFRHSSDATLLGVSDDGKRLYTTHAPFANLGEADLFVWDTATGQLLAKHPLGSGADRIAKVGFGPEGVRVLDHDNANWKYQMRIVNPDTGKTIHTGQQWSSRFEQFTNDTHWGNWYNFSHDAGWLIRPGKKLGYQLFHTTTGKKTEIEIDGEKDLLSRGYLFDPANRHFLAIIAKGVCQLHTLPDGKLAATIPNPGEKQLAAAFTPDGKHILLWVERSGSWSLEAFDIATKTRRTIIDKQTVSGRITFSPDSKRFARVPVHDGGYHPEGDWEIWDFATAKQLGQVPSHAYISDVLFSPDGRTLFTQPGYRTVVPWDIATSQPARNAPNPPGPIDLFRFTANGSLVGLSSGSVYTWDASTGKELARKRQTRNIDWHGAVTFSPLAERLHFTELGDNVVAFDWRTGAEQRSPLKLQRSGTTYVEQWFTTEGSLHVEYVDGHVILRNPATGKQTHKVSVPEEWRPRNYALGLRAATVSGDGRRLALGSDATEYSQKDKPAFISIYNLDTPGKAITLNATGPCTSLAFSPDSKLLVGNLRAGIGAYPPDPLKDLMTELGVWNAASGRRIATLSLDSTAVVNAVRFSPDGRLLAVSFGEHKVILVETLSWQVRASISVPGWPSIGSLGYGHSSDAIAWSPDSQRIATATMDGGLLVWDVRQLGASGSSSFEPDRIRTALGGDAAEAFVAMKQLAAAPERAIPFLQAQVAPVAVPDTAKLKAMIAALGGEEFQDRERAMADLERMGNLAVPALRQALKTTDSAEASGRISRLIDRVGIAKLPAEGLRGARAAEVMEWVGSPEAKKLLEAWAAGAEGARLTIEAKAALDRLKKK
jgi:WD40 repeat protein